MHREVLMDSEMRSEVSRVITEMITKHCETIGFGYIQIIGLSNDNLILIRSLYQSGIVHEDELRKAFHEVLIRSGVRSFGEITRLTAPDHTSHPYAIGYAAKHGVLTSEQTRHIVFDHDETIEQYIEESTDLLDKVMKIVLVDKIPTATKTKEASSDDYDPHPTCDCCC